MAGNLSEQATRAEKWLVGQKWKIRKSTDYRPRSDIQLVERILADVPREFLRGLVEYLQNVGEETNPQIEGNPYFGTWTFSRHIWERDQEPDNNTLTFVQTMVCGAGMTKGFIVEKSCVFTITQTFYWDVAALPTVPQSTNGVGYNLAGIILDKETGRYSGVVEKRESVAQEEHGSFLCNSGSKPGTLYWWWWKNQVAGYGEAKMDGSNANAHKSLSCSLNELGLEDGTATSFVSTETWISDSYVSTEQVSYRDTLEHSENRRSTGSATEDDDGEGAKRGIGIEYVRIHRVKITTNNESQHGAAAAIEHGWTELIEAPDTKSYPIDSGVRSFRLATGKTIFQAYKVEEFGYSPWKRVPEAGLTAGDIADLADTVPEDPPPP